jgi:hypothetical protein
VLAVLVARHEQQFQTVRLVLLVVRRRLTRFAVQVAVVLGLVGLVELLVLLLVGLGFIKQIVFLVRQLRQRAHHRPFLLPVVVVGQVSVQMVCRLVRRD